MAKSFYVHSINSIRTIFLPIAIFLAFKEILRLLIISVDDLFLLTFLIYFKMPMLHIILELPNVLCPILHQIPHAILHILLKLPRVHILRLHDFPLNAMAHLQEIHKPPHIFYIIPHQRPLLNRVIFEHAPINISIEHMQNTFAFHFGVFDLATVRPVGELEDLLFEAFEGAGGEGSVAFGEG